MIKQPMLGLAATAIVVAIALAFISLFSFATFTGWVGYYIPCLIPMQIVIALIWGCKSPGFAARRNQPAKGALLILIALLVGTTGSTLLFKTVGGGISPPTPMLVMCSIVTVVVTFWAAIIWGGWPFTAIIKQPVAAGLAMLGSCYVVNYLVFRIFFNFGFMKGAPVYVPALDPQGLFHAWYVLVFLVTAIATMFLIVNFELWPFSKKPGLMRQPVLGMVWTLAVLVIAGVLYYVGVFLAGVEVVAFMMIGPIPFIFGTIVVQNMFRGLLFAKAKQPVKGILNAISALAIGSGLARAYGPYASFLSGPIKVGPPAYDYEIWLLSALLAVTFPFLIFYADFFEFWPLKRAEKPAAQAVSAQASFRAAK